MQRPLQEGAGGTSSQADEEPGLKQLWIERWKEGQRPKPQASRALGEVKAAEEERVDIRGDSAEA
jgi:hypothetical protein